MSNLKVVRDTAISAPFTAATPDGHPVNELRVDDDGALWVRSGTVDLQLAPTESTLLVSAARIAEATTEVTNTAGYKGVVVFIDVTLDPAEASITPHIEGNSGLSDEWYTILTGAAITGTGNTVLRAFPGATAAANTVANDQLPALWRFRMAVADTDTITYSVNAILLP